MKYEESLMFKSQNLSAALYKSSHPIPYVRELGEVRVSERQYNIITSMILF